MKKFIVSILAVVFTIGGITGCKDDDPTFSTERPVTAFFDDDAISDPSEYDEFVNSGYWEFGFEFSVTKSGDIVELGAKIPDDDDARVTIWDMADTTIVAQKTITAVDGVATFESLAGIVALTPGKKYAITLYSNDYYLRIRTGSANYPYPITKGNVNITKFLYASRPADSPAIYPNNLELQYISGLQDFTFRTED